MFKLRFFILFILFIAKITFAELAYSNNQNILRHITEAEKHVNKNIQIAKAHIDTSLLLLENVTNKELLPKALLIQCQIYTKEHRYEEAYSIANKIMPQFEKTRKASSLAKIHSIIAKYLVENSLYNEALEEYWQSSLYFEQAKDVANFVKARNEVGNCLYELNRKEEAKTYFNFVKIYAETNKDSIMLYQSFKNLARAYEKQPDQAIELYKTSINLGEKIEFYEELAELYLSLASVFVETNKPDSALYYLNKPLRSFNILRKKDKQQLLLQLALLYSKQNNIDSAIVFINELKKYSDSYDDSKMLEDVHLLKSDIYSQKKNYEEAFFQLLEAYKINDSLNKLNYNKGLFEIKEKYYYKQKARQSEINRLAKENQVKEQRLKTLSLAMLSVFLVLLIIMGLLNAQKQRKLNSSLKIKNEQINKSNIQLRNTINTRDRLISVIAHDIKNPLGSISGFAELLLMTREKPEKVQQYASIIFKSATNLHSLLENLLTWANSQTEQVVLSPTTININKIVKNTLSLLDAAAKEYNINLLNECSNDHQAYADSNSVQTIIRNLTSNAIKFSDPDSNVRLSSEINNEQLIVKVQDNGVGIQKDDLPKLFSQDIDRENIGNHKNKGTGVGLLLCKEFIELNNGKIEVLSEIGKGSTFIIHLPLSKK